jgi:hypothetical protein
MRVGWINGKPVVNPSVGVVLAAIHCFSHSVLVVRHLHLNQSGLELRHDSDARWQLTAGIFIGLVQHAVTAPF